MPVHEWSRVEAGSFHDFHHSLVHQISRELNGSLLAPRYYARVEPFVGGLSPDVLTMHAPQGAETEMEAYRRKPGRLSLGDGGPSWKPQHRMYLES